MLAARRLTEAQLRSRLQRRGYSEDAIRDVVEACRAEGFLDDRLFAQLFVDGRVAAIGDSRLVADLVRRGVDREAARAAVATAERDEDRRLDAAIDKLFRTRAGLSYPSAARALERLGFPAASIYRTLRKRAGSIEHLENRGFVSDAP